MEFKNYKIIIRDTLQKIIIGAGSAFIIAIMLANV